MLGSPPRPRQETPGWEGCGAETARRARPTPREARTADNPHRPHGFGLDSADCPARSIAGLKLSFVVALRDPDYGTKHGMNNLYRTQLFVENLSYFCDAFDLPAELIFVEWNPVREGEFFGKSKASHK